MCLNWQILCKLVGLSVPSANDYWDLRTFLVPLKGTVQLSMLQIQGMQLCQPQNGEPRTSQHFAESCKNCVLVCNIPEDYQHPKNTKIISSCTKKICQITQYGFYYMPFCIIVQLHKNWGFVHGIGSLLFHNSKITYGPNHKSLCV